MINYLRGKNQNQNKKLKKLNFVNNIYFIIYYIINSFFIFTINSAQPDTFLYGN